MLTIAQNRDPLITATSVEVKMVQLGAFIT